MIDDLVTENAELQQQLTRAEETIRRDQQQVRKLVHVHVCTCKGIPWDFPIMYMWGGYISVYCIVRASLIFQVAELQQQLQSCTQQLQSSEREKVMYGQQLTRAEETIRREQQQIQEMRQQVSDCVVACSVCCD